MVILPTEIINYILEYNVAFHPKLLKCHKELLSNRPLYYHKSVDVFTQKDNFNTFIRNKQFFIINSRSNYYPFDRVQVKLPLHCIEIHQQLYTSNGFGFRNFVFYYGWGKKKDLDKVKMLSFKSSYPLSPDFY